MIQADVLLATGAEWPTLHDDEEPLIEALSLRGLRASPAVWTDASVEWEAARIVVVRGVFDYTRARDEFCGWAERVAAVTPLHNPAEVLRWNSHKAYLRDLENDGVPIVPTVWAEAGSQVDLAALLAERGWRDAVVKAAVDNGARAAVRVSLAAAAHGQRHIENLLPTRDLMVQPYIFATETIGEHALVFIDGEFSHAVRKDQMLAGRPFSLERVPLVNAEAVELELARHVLNRFRDPLLYARVDTICDGDQAMLMELEVLEPVLFFTKAAGSAERMASAIVRRLERRSNDRA